MIRFFTSLSFLYGVTIVSLLIYGLFYYRDFVKGRFHHRRFPIFFGVIAFCCLGFLWIQTHAPLALRTYSNLDHHFIRHKGYAITGSFSLGYADTASDPGAAFNNFTFSRKGSAALIQSAYSEDPLYVQRDGPFRLLSVTYPAAGHTINFRKGTTGISVSVIDEKELELKTGADSRFRIPFTLKRGSSIWNLVRENDSFIGSPFFNNPEIAGALKNVYLLRDGVTRREGGELRFFLSGRLLRSTGIVQYEGKTVTASQLAINEQLADGARIAWGIGFLDNNRNQYRLQFAGTDTLLLLNQYPVSYPLTEENKRHWTPHGVSKFMLADSRSMNALPPGFREGFLFNSPVDSSGLFPAVLLTYQFDAAGKPLQLLARDLKEPVKADMINNDQWLLPARDRQAHWLLQIQDTFNWEFGSITLAPSQWQLLIFGALIFYILLIGYWGLRQAPGKLNWVWQLLACITLVLLTTRFFLYWRYKSFPPYEGLDLPSQQQLLSIGNFAIILAATILLALFLGSGLLVQLLQWISRRTRNNSLVTWPARISERLSAIRQKMYRKADPRIWFFGSWMLLLAASGGFAAINNFDAGVCRHIAIALVVVYFIYLQQSYRYSPLSTATERAWWRLHTGRRLDLLISNPVKIFLSLSLLALFALVDIGFAIVFFNFLLFNEAFLCINFGIGGLSAGSKKNAVFFGTLGILYLVAFILNLLYAPYVFRFILALPDFWYTVIYAAFAGYLAFVLARLLYHLSARRRKLIVTGAAVALFLGAFFFFPKHRILEKASMTKFRIDVLTAPADQAIASAYEEGKTYAPVIRAAQNQWFINTFIDKENNPAANGTGFTLLPHAPQNKGAKYNAQATDLVTSRFLIAEHGKTSVLLLVCLLLLPVVMLGGFYQLYPDFTSRVNPSYSRVVTGFSVLNYLVLTALMVVLAATGRYIFFGQDLPFGSILSKQSILFPAILIVLVVLLLKQVPAERFAHRRKLLPGASIFILLIGLLFFFQPPFNRNREFSVAGLASSMDSYLAETVQPMLDYIDTARSSRRLSLKQKDQLFTDSLRKRIQSGQLAGENKFFLAQLREYAQGSYMRHLDQRRLLYLDPNTSVPKLAVNEQYFRVDPPPHLLQLWAGNVYADTLNATLAVWSLQDGHLFSKRETIESDVPLNYTTDGWTVSCYPYNGGNRTWISNTGSAALQWQDEKTTGTLAAGDSLVLLHGQRVSIRSNKKEWWVTLEPDAFMRNYYVNGSRYYYYPLQERFIWARNFAEAISADYTRGDRQQENAFISLDYEWTDSLTRRIQELMSGDVTFGEGAEYGICIADGNGRVLAMVDNIKGLLRVNPNQKTAFNRMLQGDEGVVSQSALRKQIGNLNLLRLNPGPGSTLKPIVFGAVASQLPVDWSAFQSAGFDEKQNYFAGMRVPEYDFEKNNGRISQVSAYLRYSDNYYHANVLLLGSYAKQPLDKLLAEHFTRQKPGTGVQWPWFEYKGQTYFMNGFKNWPGYSNGKADFGDDSSAVSIGLLQNFDIYNKPGTATRSFQQPYDRLLLGGAYQRSGFILPESPVFDQQAAAFDHRIAYDLFTHAFRGHVKGSSQVLVPPMAMVSAFGKLVSQNRQYQLTLNPYAGVAGFSPFYLDAGVAYPQYLQLMKEQVFTGMREALFAGTGAELGRQLKQGAPYYYYGKTGTTGDDEKKTKSKLFTLVISQKDLASSGHVFRNNNFLTVYFTSQNGPARQNEAFQAAIVKYLEGSGRFKHYMENGK